ncbi:hypothetical protein R6Q57_012223 [Mikania cordata]
MSSPCIKEVSRACLPRCCPNKLLGQPEYQGSEQSTTPSRYDFIAATAISLHPNAQFTNHECLPTLAQAFSSMKNAYPNYPETDQADRIRDQEYHQLTLSKHVCLDYIGHGLFSYSQQLHSNAPFFSIIYKSVNLYVQITRGGQESEFETKIKTRLFRFMNISSDDYSLVFTANQSSAFKVLAESYPFHSNRHLLTVYDHENEAVETMIESCRKRSGCVDSAVFSWPNMRIQSKRLRKLLVNKHKNKKKRGLFVFPLQSKVTGSRYSYLWMGLAQENGWHVCLDANALGAKDMETLGLSLFQPDFLICSFYKVFGENPSGFGCLFIKKSRSMMLKNSTTNVGLVNIVQTSSRPLFLQESTSTDRGKTVLSSSSSSSLIDTLEIQETNDQKEERSFYQVWKQDKSLDIKEKSRKNESSSSGVSSDIEFRGLDNADSLGLVLISSRVRYLVNWLVNAFCSLKHPHTENGVPLVRIYGPKVRVDRGPVVAFNVFDWKGEKIEPTLVQKLADRHNISLSNAILKHVSFMDKSSEEWERHVEVKNKENEGQNSMLTNKKNKVYPGIPVIMATIGFLTNFEDVYRVWAFVSRFLDADFVEKERWRYMALNQTTVEV